MRSRSNKPISASASHDARSGLAPSPTFNPNRAAVSRTVGNGGTGHGPDSFFIASYTMRTLIAATRRASSSSRHSSRTPRWYPFGSDSYVARGRPNINSARCDSGLLARRGEFEFPEADLPLPGSAGLSLFRRALRRRSARSSALVPSRAASSVPRLYLGACVSVGVREIRLAPSESSEE